MHPRNTLVTLFALANLSIVATERIQLKDIPEQKERDKNQKEELEKEKAQEVPSLKPRVPAVKKEPEKKPLVIEKTQPNNTAPRVEKGSREEYVKRWTVDVEDKMNSGRWEEAHNLNTKILTADPNNKAAVRRKPTIAWKLYEEAKDRGARKEMANDVPGAIIAYKTALEWRADNSLKEKVVSLEASLDGNNEKKSADIYISAFKEYQSGRKNDAYRLCREALQLDPNNIHAERMLERLQPKNQP